MNRYLIVKLSEVTDELLKYSTSKSGSELVVLPDGRRVVEVTTLSSSWDKALPKSEVLEAIGRTYRKPRWWLRFLRYWNT